MLRWKSRQRAVLVGMLPELANLGVAGLVFGQAISDRPFSWSLIVTGIGIWLVLVSVAMWLAGADDHGVSGLAGTTPGAPKTRRADVKVAPVFGLT